MGGPLSGQHPGQSHQLTDWSHPMITTRRRLLGAAAAATGGLAAPWVHAQKTEKVKLSWLPIMQTTALYVALQDKLFEKAGIEAEAVQFQNPNQIIDSLVANQADVGAPGAAAGITMLAEARYPGTFKVFGLQGGGVRVDRINDGLIVRNGSTIRSFKDLRGKSLGHLPGIQWRTISRYMLRVNGLEVRVSPVAPLAMAQNMEEINSIMQFMQIAATMGNEGQLAIKTSDALDFIGDKLGVPASVRTTAAERAYLIEEQRKLMQQDQAMMAMAGQQQAVAENQQAAVTPDQAMMGAA
jgi:ABC-type nitrate/sulfonate/bicarbonate transport system substrate-binding protein